MTASRMLSLLVAAGLVAAAGSFRAHADDEGPAPETASGESPATEPIGPLALEDALALALMRNPELAVFSWETRASEARELQARKRPNPELDIRVYRLGIPRQNAQLDEARSRVVLSQAFELGGKRRRRIDLARTERDLAGLAYEAKRLEVGAAVAARFVAVLGAQLRVDSMERYLRFFEEMRDRVDGLVDRGALRSLEVHQVTRQVGLARIEHQRAESTLAAARYSLAAMWGGGMPRFTKAVGDLREIGPVPPIETVLELARQGPAIARWDVELARGQAALELAESSRIPDFNIGTGVRWQRNFDERDYLVDLEVTLPIFDRKQGDVREARHDVERARSGRDAARAATDERIAELYYLLVEARTRSVTLGDEVVPAARAAFEAYIVGYDGGVETLEDLFDARRDLARAEVDQVDALVDYHQTLAFFEGALGQGLAGPD